MLYSLKWVGFRSYSNALKVLSMAIKESLYCKENLKNSLAMQNYEKLPDVYTVMFIHHSQRQFYSNALSFNSERSNSIVIAITYSRHDNYSH